MTKRNLTDLQIKCFCQPKNIDNFIISAQKNVYNGAQQNRLDEAILMNTHNINF